MFKIIKCLQRIKIMNIHNTNAEQFQVFKPLDPFEARYPGSGQVQFLEVDQILEGRQIPNRCLIQVKLAQVDVTAPRSDVAVHRSGDFDIAVRVAADPAELAQLRAGLRGRMRASPLLDAQGFTRDLEALYRQAWRKWCAQALAQRN